jgi:hypothetical protein
MATTVEGDPIWCPRCERYNCPFWHYFIGPFAVFKLIW